MASSHRVIDQRIKVMEIDVYRWDIPRHKMIVKYQAGDVKDGLWPSHYAGREREYFQIEKLNNFEQITKPFGSTVAAFPIKIEQPTGAWVRAVTIIEE
jgi:kynurenine formamidase